MAGGAGGAGEQGPGATLQTGLLLAAAAVLSAISIARGAAVSGQGSLHWQRAVMDQVQLGALTVEDVRFVFSEQAGTSLSAAAAAFRAEEYRRAAGSLSGEAREAVIREAGTQEEVLRLLREAAAAAIVDPARLEAEGASALVERLAAERSATPEVLALDPDAEQALGDRLSERGVLVTLGALLPALGFLLGTLSQAFGARRRLLAAAWALCAAGVVWLVLAEAS